MLKLFALKPIARGSVALKVEVAVVDDGDVDCVVDYYNCYYYYCHSVPTILTTWTTWDATSDDDWQRSIEVHHHHHHHHYYYNFLVVVELETVMSYVQDV